MRDLTTRFWSKVDCDSDDQCWNWCATRNKEGYGRFRLGDKIIDAHRISYQLEVGEIPNDKEIHHLCNNPTCVNPHHLTMITRKEHNEIGENKSYHQNSRKTHCPQGHEYTQENTSVRRGLRYCRICGRASFRKWWNKNRRGKTI